MKLLKSAVFAVMALIFAGTAHANSNKDCVIHHSASPELQEEFEKRRWKFKNAEQVCRKLEKNNAMLLFLDTRTITNKESVGAVFLSLADKKMNDQGFLLTNAINHIQITRSPTRSEQAERDLLYISAMTAIEQLGDKDFSELNESRKKLKQFDPKKPLSKSAFGGDDQCLMEMIIVNDKMNQLHKEYGFDGEFGFNEENFQKNCAELKQRKSILYTNSFHSTNNDGTIVAVVRLQQIYEYLMQGIPMFSKGTETAMFYTENDNQTSTQIIEDSTQYTALNKIISSPFSSSQLRELDKTRKALSKLK